ncbi:phage tail protein [Clostridium facile]|uniref:Tail fiber protein n=1 Tax=Clostridium facile TaxID=2763035 RepID=A0ABR7IP58_9CLOT|nr:tail fiber protein [Clostridium facile]MBC5786915.1 tail fiber protein [Clostridium facile]
MQHIQEIILDIGLTGKNQRVKAKQWDNQTRIVKAMVLNNGVAAEFDSGIKARYSYCKPDNTQVLGDAERNGNLVTILLDPQCLTVSGICYCDITFYQGEAEISTATFEVEVYPGVYSPDRLESSDEYLSLSKVLEEAQTAVEEMEHLNDEVTSGEEERVKAETQRKTNESNRSSAESVRIQNENNRIAAETNRVNAENSRVTEFNTIKSKSDTAIQNAQSAAKRANDAAASVEGTDIGKVMEEFKKYVPNTRTINSKPLSSDISLTYTDVNAVPTTRTVNGKPLSQNLTAADIGACQPGSILVWSTSTAPTGWLLCNGSSVSRTTYSALYNKITTKYGSGNGSTTFTLPNLKGRVPVGVGSSPFTSLGNNGGSTSVTLTVSQIPQHNHGQVVTAGENGTSTRIDYAGDGAGNIYTQGAKSENTGGGSSHTNLQPYLTVNYIIKY